MKFTSYTNIGNSKIVIDTDEHMRGIKDSKIAKHVKNFKKAKTSMAEWDSLKFRYKSTEDYYELTVYWEGLKILTSYGAKNEKGRSAISKREPFAINSMSNEKTPFAVDILDMKNYAIYALHDIMDGWKEHGLTGTLTTLCGILSFTGKI